MLNPEFITKEDVCLIHDDQIASFGGSYGIRDEKLLDSAIAQPKITFSGQLLHPTIEDQASAYLFHIAKNHPFIDGNKRTAFRVMLTFLLINNYQLNCSKNDAYNLVIDVATGKLNKEEIASFLRENLTNTE